MTKKNEISDLEERLRGVNERLSQLILAMLRDDQSSVISSLKDIAHAIEETAASSNHRMDQFFTDLVSLKTHIQKTGTDDATVQQLSTRFDALEKWMKEVGNERRILKSLCFESMKSRHSNVKDAHQSTLEWLFHSQSLTFKEWLEKGNDIFWVGGKAGSGKSTLMKYICDNERTLKALRTWSHPCNLVHASYFFWNAGDVLQKSQEGLLRSLLYQILRQCPTMISFVCGQRQVGESWTRSELFDAVHRLAVQENLQARFCFFVDGLDEYDGDSPELIGLLRKLAASPYVKLCVSSRPWNAFVDAFDKSKWRMMLQDLTQDDMTAYVADELARSDMFRRICTTDSRAKSLVTQISEKAQGVWLWVFLVVRSLLRGLGGEDDFPLLQKRLDEFPADLEMYFRHMFRKIEPIYREQIARLLRVMVAAKEPIPVVTLAFLELESNNPDYALRDPIPPDDASFDFEVLQRRLNHRCTDLVEIVNYHWHEHALLRIISFLHRTVKDFLADKYMEEELKGWAGPTFDESTSLCRLYVAIIRSGLRDGTSFYDRSSLGHYARQLEHYHDRSEVALLDKLRDHLGHEMFTLHAVTDLDMVMLGVSRNQPYSSRF